MVLDRNKITLKKCIENGALYVVEQIPKHVEYSDQTNILRKGKTCRYFPQLLVFGENRQYVRNSRLVLVWKKLTISACQKITKYESSPLGSYRRRKVLLRTETNCLLPYSGILCSFSQEPSGVSMAGYMPSPSDWHKASGEAKPT